MYYTIIIKIKQLNCWKSQIDYNTLCRYISTGTHERRQFGQDNSWATLNKRSPFPGTLNSTITITHCMDRQEVIICKCSEMDLFCRTFGDGKYVDPPPPSLNSPFPPPPKKGKKSEGKEAQKGTKVMNCLKILIYL